MKPTDLREFENVSVVAKVALEETSDSQKVIASTGQGSRFSKIIFQRNGLNSSKLME